MLVDMPYRDETGRLAAFSPPRNRASPAHRPPPSTLRGKLTLPPIESPRSRYSRELNIDQFLQACTDLTTKSRLPHYHYRTQSLS